jgi:ABC-type oligopeptide transport system substrate-binding subunit
MRSFVVLLVAAATVLALTACSSGAVSAAATATVAPATSSAAPSIDPMNAADPQTAARWTAADDGFLSYLGPEVTHGAQPDSANAYALVVAGQTDCVAQASGTQSFTKPVGLAETDDDAKLIWQAAVLNLCPDALAGSGE